jgi:hypothetical protein
MQVEKVADGRICANSFHWACRGIGGDMHRKAYVRPGNPVMILEERSYLQLSRVGLNRLG